MIRNAVLMILLLMCQTLIANLAPAIAAGQTHSNSAGSMAREVYAGRAVGRDTMANLVEGDLGDKPTPFTLEVAGYTPTPDAERYAQILKTKGQDGLLETLRMENLGNFRLGCQPEHAIIFAQQSQDETGRTIRVLCQRWLNRFIEGNEDRGAEFPFAYIELSIDKSGNCGEGTMYTAASVKFNNRTGTIVGVARYEATMVINKTRSSLGVEDYANNRDWLQDVRSNLSGLAQARQ